MNNLVSIITPSYNSELYISEMIISVLNQTYKNFELIIVNDKSTDNSPLIIEKFVKNDDRVKLINLEVNLGVAFARNIGIKNSKGDYIAFLDSDDKWYSNKLEEQLKFMIINNYHFTFTTYNRFDNHGNILSVVKAPSRIDYKMLLKTCYPGCLTVMINRSYLDNLFFSTQTKREDFGLWLNVIKKTVYAYGLNIELAQYRVHSSQSSKKKLNMAYETWLLYRKIEKLNLFSSFFYFLNYSIRGFYRTYLIKYSK